MEILRTPDDEAAQILAGIADYPPGSRFVTIPSGDDQELRLHLVDAGPSDAPVMVFLHGNPSWSFIWRHQIAAAVAAGYRAIAPDLVGMGLSDKPADLDDYSVTRHVRWTRSLLFDALGLRTVSFVLHDWGGIIGMRLAAENPDRVDRMVISNTGLPWRDITEPLPAVIEATGPFAEFQAMARQAPRWEPWNMLPMVMETEPSPNVQHGYRAPYPDPSLTIGSRAFTQLLPTRPDNPMYADNYWAWKALESWTRPVLTIFSDRDKVAPDGWRPIVDRIPGAAGQPHLIIEGGGHFLQEDVPDAYSGALMAWMGSPS